MKNTARLFKALADETRLRILALLTRGELCVCDLMTVLDLPQSTVSRHLAYLRNAGWVEDRRQGVWMYYRLTRGDHLLQRELLPLLAARLEEIPEALKDLSALDGYLADKPGRCG
jgi:ArsR family transcriptional regulator